MVLAWDPTYCLDACGQDTQNADCAFDPFAPVLLNVCDEALPMRRSQRWFFRPRGVGGGEVVNAGAMDEGATHACLGWAGGPVGPGASLALHPCDGSKLWDEAFYRETEAALPVHGAFYFDPYGSYDQRSTRVAASVWGDAELQAAGLTDDDEDDEVLMDYTVWNTSVMAVVVAGNASLSILTETCPLEGCTTNAATETGGGAPVAFKWSDAAAWLAQNVSVPCDHAPLLTHETTLCSYEKPCSCADVAIAANWVVELDVETTPFLNTLTVLGTLWLPSQPQPTTLHAQLIDAEVDVRRDRRPCGDQDRGHRPGEDDWERKDP